MDEISTILLLLWTVVGVLLLSMVLHYLTIRHLREIQHRLVTLSSKAGTDQKSPQSAAASIPSPVVKKDIGTLLRSHTSIDDSLRALCELHRLKSITFATMDGLVVASTSKEAQSEAAMMSNQFNRGEITGEPGVRVFKIDHQSSTMIGIARSSEGLDDEKLAFIRENVSKILNHWL